MLSKQQKLQQYIYKLDSSLLELKHWDLKLPLEQARKMDGVVVAITDLPKITFSSLQIP